MRITKRLLSLLLSLTLLLGLAGCDLASLFGKAPSGGADDFTPPTYTEVIKTAFEGSYADQLSPNEKHIYDAVAAAAPGTAKVALTLPEQPALCKGRSPTEKEQDDLKALLSTWAANALYALWLDTPDLFWIDHTRYSYAISLKSNDEGVVVLSELTLELTVTDTAAGIAAKKAAIESAISDFRPTGKTVREKVEYINTYLCNRITYSKNAPNRANVYGALVDGKCVCEGYARAFALLAQKAGLTVVNIPGYATTDEGIEGHMWNGVLIDGALYAVDTTWNDTTKQSVYLLVGEETVCHEKAFGKTHKPDMLTLSDSHKAFALPSIAKGAYQENP